MIELRPSDIYAMQARTIRNVAGLIEQAGGLALDLYNAQAVEQENKARVFFAQSEETYDKNLPERTFDINQDVNLGGDLGLGTGGTVQKRLGELAWSDVLADYDKYYQTQLDYIKENVTNKDARTRLTQLLQQEAIRHRASVYAKWSEAAQHEANASLDNLTKTVMGQNIPWDQKVEKIGGQVREMVRVGRMWKDQGDAYMEKVTNTAQQSWAFAGTLNALETGGMDAGQEWINSNTPFWDASPEMRQKVLDAATDQKTWIDAKRNEAAKIKSWTAFEKLYADIQAGNIATYEQIDANPDLTFEDKMRADAARRTWLSEQRKEHGPPSAFDIENEDFNKVKQDAQTEVDKKTLTRDYLEAVNKKWGQTKEGGDLVRYLETQLGQIDIWRKQQTKEREAADATKTTSPECLVYFHDSFYAPDNTPEKLRNLLSWVRDNFLPSSDAPSVPRIGTDKKQQWEDMINTEIQRLESGPYKQRKTQVDAGRKTISDFWQPRLNEAIKDNNTDEYKKLLGERDKMLQEFDSQSEEVKDIPAWVNQVLQPAQHEQVRNALTGKKRPEIEAEYYKRIGLPELAPQPYRAKSTGPTHVTQQTATVPGPQQTATEIADRRVVAQYTNYRKTTAGQLALVKMPDNRMIAYDNTKKTWVYVDIQAIQTYYGALKRLK